MSENYLYYLQILTTLGFGAIIGYIVKFFLDRHNLQLTYQHKIAEKLAEKIIEYSEKYYMPLNNCFDNLASHLSRTIDNPTDQEKRYSFYILALCLSVRNKLIREIGNVILKNLNTEDKLEDIFNNFIEEMKSEAKFSLDDISKIEKIVLSDELAENFFLKMNKERSLSEIYQKFERWLKNLISVKKVIKNAKDYNNVLTQELNLIYEPWYGKIKNSK